jgi:hypothetical protein
MTTKPKTRKPAAARRESNVVPFPKTIDPEHKEDIEAAQAFVDTIDNILMRGLRKQLAEAEIKAALGDPDAKDDAEFFRLSIKLRLRDHDLIMSSATRALRKCEPWCERNPHD